MTLNSCYDYEDELLTPREMGGSDIQLAFSLGQYKTNTRLSDAAVQATDNDLSKFRGISELYLLPFITAPTSNTPEPVGADHTPLSGNVTLPRSIAAGDSQLNNETYNYNNYYRYANIPLSTDAFLCYGFGPSDTPKNDGVIVKNKNLDAVAKPSDITFSLKPIYDVYDNNNIVIPEKATALVNYLNSIYTAGGNNWNSGALQTVGDLVFKLDAYYTAGSSANILELVKRIYSTLYLARENPIVSPVITAITAKVNTTGDEVTGWMDSSLDEYPRNINLPDGAAYIEWDGTKFSVVTDKSNSSALATYSVENLVYPPSLAYFANSRIMTHQKRITGSLEEQKSLADYIFKKAGRKWGTTANYVANGSVANHSDNTAPNDGFVLDQPETTGSNNFLFTGRDVTTSTSIVAIAKPLQYAVARLDVQLKNGGAPAGDNFALLDANDNPITVTADAFPVTGIMIAGQKDVDWKFNTVTTSGAKEYTIYDSQVKASDTASPMLPADLTSTSDVIRTLAFETASEASIYVAVELENNSGADFVTGENKRIVPDGCRFYLIGKLDPTATTGVNYNNNDHKKVLCQDQVTTVTFTVKDLKNAYNVIPDFSSRELELSLGVIDWKLSTPNSTLLK